MSRIDSQLKNDLGVAHAVNSSSGRVWDSSVLRDRAAPTGRANDRSKQIKGVPESPFESYPRQTPVPTFEFQYREYLNHERMSGRLLEHTSSTYGQLHSLLTEVAISLDVDPKTVKFDVVRNPTMNAWVIRDPDSSFSHVFITTGLLQLLADDNGMVKAGQVASIFGHELGHVLEGHYDHAERIKKASSQDPIEIIVVGLQKHTEKFETQLLQNVFRRNQEFQADRHGLRAVAALGFPLSDVVEVLEKFKSLQEELPKTNSRIERNNRSKMWIAEKLTASHPGLDGRISHVKGAIHQLTIESLGKIGPQALTPSVREERISVQDVALRSPLQAKLQQLIELGASVRVDKSVSPEQLSQLLPQPPTSGDREEFESFMREAQHLYVFTPLVVRHALEQLPFKPWDGDGIECEDRNVSPGYALSSEHSNALEGFMAELYRLVDQACQAELHTREGDPAGQLEVLVERWSGIESVYHWTQESKAGVARQIRDISELDRVAAMSMVEERGKVHLDTCVIHSGIFGDMIDGPGGRISERGEQIVSLLGSGQIDRRKLLLELLTKDDLLLEASKDEVLARGHQAHRLFQEGIIERVSASLHGEYLGGWALETFGVPNTKKRAEQWRDFINELAQGFSDFSSEPECNPVVLGCINILQEEDFTSSSSKQMPSLSRFLTRIGDLVPAGINRDSLVLSRLVESHPYLKKNWHLAQVVGHLELSDPIESVFSTVHKVLQKLDLSWYTLKVWRGYSDALWGPDDLDEIEAIFTRRLTGLGRDSELPQAVFDFNQATQLGLCGPQTAAGGLVRSVLLWYMKASIQTLSSHQQELLLLSNKGDSPLAKIVAEFPEDFHKAYPYGAEFEASPRILQERASGGIAPSSALMRALVLLESGIGNENNGASHQTELLRAYFEKLPQGEFRDYEILKVLAFHACDIGIERERSRLQNLTQREESDVVAEKQEALEQLEQVVHRNDLADLTGDCNLTSDTCVALLSLLSERGQAQQDLASVPLYEAAIIDDLRTSYTNYSMFLRSQLNISGWVGNEADVTLPIYDLPTIATVVSQVLFVGHEDYESRKHELPLEERIALIRSYFVYPSQHRDALLQEVLRDAQDRNAAGNGEDPLRSGVAEAVYQMCVAPHVKHALGRELYREWMRSSEAEQASFARHLEMLARYHEPGTVSYEEALKVFFDGGTIGEATSTSSTRSSAKVRTWQEYDSVVENLQAGDAERASQIARVGAFQLIQELLQEEIVPAQDKAATLLWMAGLRSSSHLIDCYEVTYRVKADQLRGEAELLTEAEKRQLLQEVLGGPHGILRDTESARRDFLNALFAGIFGKEELSDEDRRAFKAVYDGLLFYSPPERAGSYLASFLVSHLEGKSFDEQMKLFFTSFGFVGVKTAQYLATRTNVLSPSLRAQLMDLTSRVPGPDKRIVFETLESVMGTDARSIVHSIGDHLGGGSLMTFYEVILWNDDRTGEGRKGVVGLLRPDILYALPEDLLIVRRLLEVMRDAPEFFAGKVVSTGLMDNLVWQSAVETNLARTARLQEVMRDDMLRFHSSTAGVSVSVPEIWNSGVVNGQEAKLTRGPLIFMDRGKGVTLDRFLDGRGVENPELRERVLSTLCEVLAFQLREGRCVHCDLHPGNILVDEDSEGKLHLTVLDVGLSVELSPEVSGNLFGMARLVVDHVRAPESKDEYVDGVTGTGMTAEDGRRWLGRFLEALGERHGVQSSPEAREAAVTAVWRYVTDPSIPIQERIQGVTHEVEQLGFSLPGEYYYLTRALSVSSYIWSDESGARGDILLRALRDNRSGSSITSEQDVTAVLDRATSIVTELGGEVDQEKAREMLHRLKQESDIFCILTIAAEELPSIVTGISPDDVFSALASDEDFFALLGFTESKSDDKAGARSLQLASDDDTFMARAAEVIQVSSRPPGEAGVDAERENWGYRPRVWSRVPPPGSVMEVEVENHRVRQVYQVGLYEPSRTSPDDIEVRRPNNDQARDFAHLIEMIRALGLHEFTGGKSDQDEEGSSLDRYGYVIDRLELYLKMVDRLGKESLYESKTSLGAILSRGGDVWVCQGQRRVSILEYLYDQGQSMREYLRLLEQCKGLNAHDAKASDS